MESQFLRDLERELTRELRLGGGRDLVAVNPTTGLDLPTPHAGAASESPRRPEAARLLEALPAAERALWATAFYAGLCRGELRALR